MNLAYSSLVVIKQGILEIINEKYIAKRIAYLLKILIKKIYKQNQINERLHLFY